MTTLAESRHLDRLAQLPCALCGSSGVEIHHILEGRTPGRKSSHWTAIPLCPICHRDSRDGIHGRREGFWLVRKASELALLGETLDKLYGKR